MNETFVNLRKKVELFFQKNTLLRMVLFAVVVLGITNKIYFKRYYLPTAIYWDEAYHIPAAAKYVAGVFFMEPHPPLGKMIIAAGEEMLNWGEKKFGWDANHGDTHELERYEQMQFEMPNGFTYAGYRFFPALSGWFNALLFALILIELTGSYLWALLFLPLYAFDNALIADFRGAMIDSLMIFGVLLCIWGFLRLVNLKSTRTKAGIWALFIMIFGFSFAVMTKVLALIVALFWPALWWFKRKSGELGFLLKSFVLQVLFFAIFSGAIWAYHFNFYTHTEVSLRNEGLYYASSDYEKIIFNLPNNFNAVERFTIALRDNLRFFKAYEERVPSYDLDKGNITASFPIWWAFGSRPIYFRNTYPQEPEQRHMFLMPNPAIWLTALVGLVIALGGLAVSALFSIKIFSQKNYFLMLTFATIYLIYMGVVSNIRRILYLTHYFIPLFFTFFILVLLMKEIYTGTKSACVKNACKVFFVFFPIVTFAFFLYIKPLTYYEPITCAEAYGRGFFRYWSMKVNFCPDPTVNKTFLGKPKPDPRHQAAMVNSEDY